MGKLCETTLSLAGLGDGVSPKGREVHPEHAGGIHGRDAVKGHATRKPLETRRHTRPVEDRAHIELLALPIEGRRHEREIAPKDRAVRRDRFDLLDEKPAARCQECCPRGDDPCRLTQVREQEAADHELGRVQGQRKHRHVVPQEAHAGPRRALGRAEEFGRGVDAHGLGRVHALRQGVRRMAGTAAEIESETWGPGCEGAPEGAARSIEDLRHEGESLRRQSRIAKRVGHPLSRAERRLPQTQHTRRLCPVRTGDRLPCVSEEFMDERPRRVECWKTSMDVSWQFDYAAEIEKLTSLYSKSKRLQWDAERDIDWTRQIDPSKPIVDEGRFGFDRIPFIQRLGKSTREAFTAQVAAHRLSQFLHGEQGALMVAAALVHAVPDYEGKLYAATQTMDEARHVEVFERYIRKLALVYPISPALKRLIDLTLRADHWVKIAIGMNMVVEGLALGAFHNMRRATSCELLRQVIEYVLRDEARHVAFGNVYVQHALCQMHPDDREDIADFAYQVIKMMSDATGGPEAAGRPEPDPGFREALVRCGIDPGDFVRGLAQAREAGIRTDQAPGTIRSFRDLMMPALVRVGAVTARTRARFAEAGIHVYDDPHILESLEDRETGEVMPQGD